MGSGGYGKSQYFQLFGELQFALEIGLFKIKMVFTDSNDPNRVGWISPPALQDLAAEMMPSECSPSLAFDTLLASFFPTVTVFLSLHASSWLSSLQERKSLSLHSCIYKSQGFRLFKLSFLTYSLSQLMRLE